MDQLFQFNNVRYKELLLIEHLVINKETIVCIEGESGAGKSTFLQLFNQMIAEDEGEILYKGKSVKEMNEIELRREVVMVPQVPVMFEGTVGDNAAIGRKFSEKTDATPAEINRALAIVHLSKKVEEEVTHLSGGEKQRLALARILLLDADVYLLDEPTSALDEQTEEKVIGNVLKELKRKKKTILIVSHSPYLLKTYGETRIKIKEGRVFSEMGAANE